MRPLHVYLDSSDFSVLSNPRGISDELGAVLRQLRGWVRDGNIVCCFSGTHLSEMAPLDAAYAGAAKCRAGLLVELCGKNALISQDRLFAAELRHAIGLSASLPEVHSPDGIWYPDGIAGMSPVGQIEVVSSIQNTIHELGANRAARRKANQKGFKRGLPRPTFQAAVVANARTCALDEVLALYPMRPQDARVLSRYAVGDATAEEATNAFEESLRDPSWMMQWFEKHHAQLNPFIDWIRAPSASMLNGLNEMARLSAVVRQHDIELGTRTAETLFSSSKWRARQDDLLHSIAVSMSKKFITQDAAELTVPAIDRDCPGLSVGIRSLHASWWTTTGQRPRQTRLSDFPDALHAMYAPYVDVFRADSFMAPFIAEPARKFGTTVVSKLTSLPSAIQSALATADCGAESANLNVAFASNLINLNS